MYHLATGQRIGASTPRSASPSGGTPILPEALKNITIDKWDYQNARSGQLLTARMAVSRRTAPRPTPALSADVLGDWREVVLRPTSAGHALRLDTTTIQTPSGASALCCTTSSTARPSPGETSPTTSRRTPASSWATAWPRRRGRTSTSGEPACCCLRSSQPFGQPDQVVPVTSTTTIISCIGEPKCTGLPTTRLSASSILSNAGP
jgi:hypothetical protein